ncbi:hypothetical protein L484_009707 [Morus notabilis]|uniref:Integrase zinc-binding domain-containing protein n=1 Tax=Morus notabilis TaxID=981085 RepID=W9S5U6_9ROSA|nr:hypothetical protein L484_009707 [Morus notabilis]
MVVPRHSPFIPKLLHAYHDGVLGGHLGVLKTYRRLATNWFWSGMKKDITSYVAACDVCQHCKASTLASSGLLQPVMPPMLN